ncbi:hypothetical protein SAMN04487943_107215 [Gracilibacillus orientalis]|uniref:Uncharacterized protein n=1 Tax=Gracilibacillus orientalis TaxID=334253 RepID=A0A1I4MZB0_9BACI|nr:hypothetical protein [Gracilibacillus orientalis]SFM08619.1 hypothetical protein SAMN04487943_107215 [Gracilibacillus orientalis]
MKKLVITLSVVTVTTWSIVLFFYLDLGQKNYVYADQHAAVQHKHDYKQTDFIFRSKKIPDFSERDEDTNNTDADSQQSQEAQQPLANITLNLNDDNTVSIDELMSKLDIDTE